MLQAFITLRFFDILDILITAFLLYQLYLLLKGTLAINILIGVLSIYLFWLVVKALHMQLLSTILGQFMGVGVIAMIIVFQQEIRRFFLLIGSRYLKSSTKLKFTHFFSHNENTDISLTANIIGETLVNMAKTKTGALIVITKMSELEHIKNSGVIINADISKSIIKSIFFKNSPLHDGAMLITNNKIAAARCMLPLSQRTDIPGKFGLRHRSAIGLSENTDAIVFVVSEETGTISYSIEGGLEQINNKEEIVNIISNLD